MSTLLVIAGVLAFLAIIATPIYLEERQERLAEQAKIAERTAERKRMDAMFSEPAPWGLAGTADMPELEPKEPRFNGGFSGSAAPVQVKIVQKRTAEEIQMLNALTAMARVSDRAFSDSLLATPDADSNLAKLVEACSTATPEQIKAWMRETGPWTGIEMPDFEITEGDLKRLVKIFFLIRTANRYGFSQRIVSEDMLKIAKGGSKAYAKFKVIFDTIREYEIPYQPTSPEV